MPRHVSKSAPLFRGAYLFHGALYFVSFKMMMTITNSSSRVILLAAYRNGRSSQQYNRRALVS